MVLALVEANMRRFPQQHPSITAVCIVAVETWSLRDGPVLLHRPGFLVAGEAHLWLRHQQGQCRHVAVGLRQMADGARKLDGGVHRFASGLIRVTGGAIFICMHTARVFNAAILSGRRWQCR